MKKCIVMPDSFKGTMSSIEVCSIMMNSIHEIYPDCQVIQIPVADGGEGTVDCFLSALGGRRVELTVSGPFFERMTVQYGLIDNDRVAVVEMSSCAGLPLVQCYPDPSATTTFGVGEMISDALQRGCKKVIVGLGGSCTNDGGTGMAAALGTRFYDANGREFVPVGRTLKDIEHIEFPGPDSQLYSTEILGMCDVNNPLFGDAGASRIFGPQKGADEAMIVLLDSGLKHLSQKIYESTGLDIGSIPGSGAGGGMGAGMVAFLDAQLKRGIDVVLDIVNFESMVENADCVFTGEGRIDHQSMNGKVVVGIANRAKPLHIPVIAIVGDVESGIDQIYDEGIHGIISINTKAVPLEEAKLHSRENLAFTMKNLISCIHACSGQGAGRSPC